MISFRRPVLPDKRIRCGIAGKRFIEATGGVEQPTEPETCSDAFVDAALWALGHLSKPLHVPRLILALTMRRYMAIVADMCRIKLVQTLKAGVGLIEPANQAQCPAKANPGLDKIWPQIRGAAKALGGSRRIVFTRQSRAAGAVEDRIVWLQCDRTVMARYSLIEPFQLDQQQT